MVISYFIMGGIILEMVVAISCFIRETDFDMLVAISYFIMGTDVGTFGGHL